MTDQVLIDGHLTPAGGRSWKCVYCDTYYQADCECCEPSARCRCPKAVDALRRERTREVMLRIAELKIAAYDLNDTQEQYVEKAMARTATKEAATRAGR